MSKSLNILCVDDEESVLKSLTRIFRGEPFGVLTATSGEKGLAILKEKTNIGLIISDQRMPGMSGAVFLEAAKALFPHIPRMILSGFADQTMASDAIKQGDVLHYMHKPWDDAELRRTVHEALQKFLVTQATHGDHQEDKEWTVRRYSLHESTEVAVIEENEKIKVLFVCVHNSARSQMAEAMLNHLASDRYGAQSAGLDPGTLNPLAVEVMAEIGLDISQNKTKGVFDFYKQGALFNYVITVCDGLHAERCPIFPGHTERVHCSFPDPAALTGSHDQQLAACRVIRDQIKTWLEQWIA